MPLATQEGDPSLLLEAVCTHGQGPCCWAPGQRDPRAEGPLISLQNSLEQGPPAFLGSARRRHSQRASSGLWSLRSSVLSGCTGDGLPAGNCCESPEEGLPPDASHVRASVQLGLHRGAPSLARSGCVTLWASSQSRPACVWQGTFGLIHSGLARDGPGRPRLFAPRVQRKWLQPGGSQILPMTDGPGALLGYC